MKTLCVRVFCDLPYRVYIFSNIFDDTVKKKENLNKNKPKSENQLEILFCKRKKYVEDSSIFIILLYTSLLGPFQQFVDQKMFIIV